MQDVEVQPNDYADVLAANVRRARAGAGITQTSLAKRMRQLGCKWHFQTVGAVERGERPISAYEAAALTLALVTTRDVLELPPSSEVEVTFSGHVVPRQRLRIIDDSVAWDGDTLRVTQPSVLYRPADLRIAREPDAEARAELEVLRDQLRRRASDQPIVAAIVTSDRGVLVGRRMDGKPPWTFIAGEQEPGERPGDTAVREVKEETGLQVRAGEVIGERVHPKSGRHMTYMAAAPTHGTDVFVGDEEELAEVRWASLAEADELMSGMIYEPVHEYLARELRRQGGGAEGEQGDDQR
jgi:8-oxo-dGTP pyrophosphatase MutT (NUDIX family)